MSMSDPISDFLTQIRNGLMAQKKQVKIPGSKLKAEIARVLQENGYIKGFYLGEEDKKAVVTIELKYDREGTPVIRELRRVSRPSCRIYRDSENIPVEKNGIGMYVISTTKGIMSDRQARGAHIGGEVMCAVS